ncbi:MAG: CaiB/BaiF CoA transferase family protein [Acidimicrobiia bacterium]
MTARALKGIRVVELAGLGPAPFACDRLQDLGATVLRVERPGGSKNPLGAFATASIRNRPTVELDLKSRSGSEMTRTLIANADVLVEGFRPGTTERLGLGPSEMSAANPRLIYCRVTGWGQEGPYAGMAGHDINYIGLSGVLASVGADRPTPPLNLVGDYGGGSMFAITGILAALVERFTTGLGQTVDVAMVDGAASLLGPIRELADAGLWKEKLASNILDGGAPFYRTYRTSDDRYMAVGALEPAFYSALMEGLGLDESTLPDRNDPRNWQALSEVFEGIFASKTRDEWGQHFVGTDACVTPVLAMSEVGADIHNVSREALIPHDGSAVPNVAPRMGSQDAQPAPVSLSAQGVVREFGLDEAAVGELVGQGSVYTR